MAKIGPRMREIQDIVSAMPGISQAAALRAAGLPTSGRGYDRPISRAANAGLIIYVPGKPGRPSKLFASDRDRQIYELREELLHGGPTAARAEEIVAEIEALRQEQAETWQELPGPLTARQASVCRAFPCLPGHCPGRGLLGGGYQRGTAWASRIRAGG